MSRWLDELGALVWTLAGTGLVLITLSGPTRTWGWWITGFALVCHLLIVSMKKDGES